MLLLSPAAPAADTKPVEAGTAQVNAVLDDWHRAAAKADEARYFGHLTADAVFLGTDAKERWTRDEFRKWARPYFKKGKAWTFKAARRHVTVSADGKVAWFDEALETANLGPCRGSGVLVLDGKRWKIAQYNLSVPIPNEAFADVKKIIEAAGKRKPQSSKEGRKEGRQEKKRFLLPGFLPAFLRSLGPASGTLAATTSARISCRGS
jgi:ketosteroid isomerase-like protein